METARVRGGDLSVYRTTAISLGVSKNVNRSGIKSRFAMVQCKDQDSIIASKSTVPVFEEDMGTQAFEELLACRMLNAQNQPVTDSAGGEVVDITLLRKRIVERIKDAAEMLLPGEKAEDPLNLDKILRFEGGMTQTYIFPDGPRYANDQNGQRTTDKSGQPVVKSSCDVFVQVKYVDPDGTYHYFSGWELARRGERIMNTFFKVPFQAQTVPMPGAGATQGQSASQTQQQGLPPVQGASGTPNPGQQPPF